MAASTPVPPTVALTLAGSDCSAGAGLQADLKAFSAMGVYGLTVVTAVVAEVPGEVSEVQALSPRLVIAQYDLVLRTFPVAAVKTGLLGSPEIIDGIADRLTGFQGPVVVDPVAVASTGQSLAPVGYGDALRRLIVRAATLMTPNRAEAEAWLGIPIRDERDARAAALQLSVDGACAVLLKGGHFDGPQAIDWLAMEGTVEEVTRERIPGPAIHGTGCAYSAAITAGLARGLPLRAAVAEARDYLQVAFARAYTWDGPDLRPTKALAHGHGPVHS